MVGILEPKPLVFKIAISQRFQVSNLGNPFQALFALEQEETMQELIGQFEKHIRMVKGMEANKKET